MSNILPFIDFSRMLFALMLILFLIPSVKVCTTACSIIAVCLKHEAISRQGNSLILL